MIFNSKYLSFCVLVLLVWACADDGDHIPKKDSDYFPMEVGGYFIYDVKETQYAPIDEPKELIYQLKLSVTDSFKNTAGGITYVIQRSTKKNIENNFEYLDTWSVRIEPSQVVVNEGSITFIKLAFPLSKGRKWNGNALNSLGGVESCGDDLNFSCDVYEIGDTGFQYKLNGDTSNETIEVVLNDNPDLIVKHDVRKEIYVRNIGLVYKESSILEYCTVGTCIGQQQIEKGFLYEQTLTSYGKE